MTNSQLLLVLVAFCVIVLWRDILHFLKARHKRYVKNSVKVKTNYTIILEDIGRCKTIDELDDIEAKACKLILEDHDHSLVNNSPLLIEHFNLKRYQLEGNIHEAELSAEKIEAILSKQNICRSL